MTLVSRLRRSASVLLKSNCNIFRESWVELVHFLWKVFGVMILTIHYLSRRIHHSNGFSFANVLSRTNFGISFTTLYELKELKWKNEISKNELNNKSIKNRMFYGWIMSSFRLFPEKPTWVLPPLHHGHPVTIVQPDNLTCQDEF